MRLHTAALIALCFAPNTGACAASATPTEMATRHCTNPMDGSAIPAHANSLLDVLGADIDLDLRVHVGKRDDSALDKHLVALYDPNSPDYQKFLTPAQFMSLYGPTKQEIAQVVQHLRKAGMVVEEGIKGGILKVKAKVTQAEDTFHVSLREFNTAAEGKVFGAIGHPVWSAAVPIKHVDGLSPKPPQQSHVRLTAKRQQQPLEAQGIRKAYNVPGSASGKGQTLGMIELDGYDPKDLDFYAKSMGIRRVPTKNILVNGYDGKVHDAGAQGEVTLDIQLANALAPGLDEIRVYETSNGEHALLDIFTEIANPTLGDKKMVYIHSLSWGGPEDQMSASDVAAENAVLRQMAAQGQTVFVAAGDSGARDDGRHIGTDDPASQPWAVAVGGTTLTVLNGVYKSERTWTGGGGGISCYWKAPAWQVGLDGPGSKASLTNRDVPDVSLNADPATGYAVYVAGQWQVVGGTSCAAPLWAAFATLVDERRMSLKKPRLGFFAKALYQVAQTPAGKAGLHDIADNSTNGYYPAVTGLDDATGWGSFNGSPLLDAFGAL